MLQKFHRGQKVARTLISARQRQSWLISLSLKPACKLEVTYLVGSKSAKATQ